MTKTVQMETSAGTLVIELDDAAAPLSTANFPVSYTHLDVYKRQASGKAWLRAGQTCWRSRLRA